MTDFPLRILLIEDNPGDARLLKEMLREADFPAYELVWVQELAEGLARMGSEPFDVVLLDLGLPDSQGLETLTHALAQAPGLPIIVLTGLADQEVGIQAIKAGAQDYMAKGHLDDYLLARSIRYAIERAKSEETIRGLRHELELILESAGEGIVCLDLEGRQTLVNAAAMRMLGYEPGQLVGEPSHCHWHRIRHDGTTYPPEECPIHRALRDGSVLRKDNEVFCRRDGSVFPVDYVMTPIRDGGTITGGVVVFQDITQRKAAEDALRTRERQQAAMAALGRDALQGGELQELFDRAVLAIALTLGVEYCKVLEILPGEEVLLLRSGVGWKEGLVGHAWVSAGRESQAGFTLLSNEPVVVEDMTQETRFDGPALLWDHGVKSGLSTLIEGDGKGKPFGVLGAHSTRVRSFTRDDIDFLQAMANVLAIAIQRKRAEEEVGRLAVTDALTGIANRRRFHELLEKEVQRAERYGTPFALVMYDLDHFKAVNDAYGHDVGDEVLKSVATLVKQQIRGTDVVARWGGEEFMILVPEAGLGAAMELAEKLRASIAEYVFPTVGMVTSSFGVAQFEKGDDLLALEKKVDEALYQAKEQGRNRVVGWESLSPSRI